MGKMKALLMDAQEQYYEAREMWNKFCNQQAELMETGRDMELEHTPQADLDEVIQEIDMLDLEIQKLEAKMAKYEPYVIEEI